jgi:hypothetical protein
VNLESLLTFFALLAAAVAVMGPVQRRSLLMFVPRWMLPVTTLAALAFLIARDIPLGVIPPFGWRLDMVTYLLTLAAFLLPLAGAFTAWILWLNAKLTSRNLSELEPFLQTALREGELDEVDRVLQKNSNRLSNIPSGAATLLFSPRLVQRMVTSHSFIHLALLSQRQFMEPLENRLVAVENVVRELLLAQASPLQSAVVARFGGNEHLQCTDDEGRLIEATFENPTWYHDTNAHYPLIITAINQIESGELNAPYNLPDESYIAHQGVSKRSTCPLYLAIKTEVIALEAVVKAADERDFYISDLWQILMKIYEHTKWDSNVVNPPLFGEPTTPYSYLLNEIASDFEKLTENAVQISLKENGTSLTSSKPDGTGRTLVKFWCLSVWELMSEANRLDPNLLDRIVERYIRFMFALGWQTTEVIYNAGQAVPTLNEWRDVLFEEFKDCLNSPKPEHFKVLHRVFENLDFGKPFILDGYDWLQTKLHPNFFPN